MDDTTIIYYTVDLIPEGFKKATRDALLSASCGKKILTVSPIPVQFGDENLITPPCKRGERAIYKQILAGAKKATTKYVAMAEDDVLYVKEHFDFIPTNDTEFFYNRSKWSIYTWSNPPVFSLKARVSMSQLICNRELLIQTLEERHAKYPDDDNYPEKFWSEPGKYEKHLGVTLQTRREFATEVPNIVFTHETACGYLNHGTRKRLGELKAYDIPHWGKASDIVKLYSV